MKILPGLKPAVWGAVVGAVGIAVVGFSTLGWTLGSTADRMANERAAVAVVAALTPICVAKFEAQADVSKAGPIQRGRHIVGPEFIYREWRLGDHARERYAEFGRSPCMCGETRQRDLSGSEDNCRARYAGPS